MPCPNLSQEQLHAYVDGQLDALEQAEIEKHIAGCNVCAREHDSLLELKDALHGSIPYFVASKGLESRIRSHLTPRTPVSPHYIGLKWGLALAAIFMVLSGILFYKSDMWQHKIMRDEVIDRHLRAFRLGCRPAFGSNDPQAILKFLKDQGIDIPPVPDLTSEGFNLIGVRVDSVHRQLVAGILYQRNQRTIQLFVWPTGKNSIEKKSETFNGLNSVNWIAHGLEFWAVSDLSLPELEKFAKLIEHDVVSEMAAVLRLR